MVSLFCIFLRGPFRAKCFGCSHDVDGLLDQGQGYNASAGQALLEDLCDAGFYILHDLIAALRALKMLVQGVEVMVQFFSKAVSSMEKG